MLKQIQPRFSSSECRSARGQTSYCTRHSAESNGFIRLKSDETLLTQEIDDETTNSITIEYVHTISLGEGYGNEPTQALAS